MNLKQLTMLDIVVTNAVSDRPRPVAWHLALAPRKFEGWEDFTSPRPFARIWKFGKEADEKSAREAILSTRTAGSPDKRYIDPVYGAHISYQRMALMTDARRALEARDTAMTVRLLDYIASRFSFDEWHPLLKGFCGETIEESLLFAELADRTGSHRALADSLRRVSEKNHRQWARYFHALPARFHKALTPSSRRMAAEPTDTGK